MEQIETGQLTGFSPEQTTLSIEQVAEFLDITRQVTDRWIKKHSIARIKVGKRYEYLLHSFPFDFQNKWLEKHRAALLYNNDTNPTLEGGVTTAADTPPAPLPQTTPPSSSLYNNGGNIVSLQDILPALAQIQKSAGALQCLPETCRDKGYDILSLVNKVRDILVRTPKGKTEALKAFALQEGLNYRSFYRYIKKADKALKAAQKAGTDTISAQIEALAPKHGRNKDMVRAYDKNAIIYAFSLYATQNMRTMQEVYQQTVAQAQAKNWQIGTYQTLCNYLKRLDPATTTLAREGKKRFEADNIIKILRNYDEIPPNFMLCGDHHIFDVFVKLPNGKGGWTYKRPWLTSWMDMRSRSLMGWCISFGPNSRTIAMALAHAISPKDDPAFPQCGIPSSVYIDNGKDYRSKYLNGEEVAIGKIDYPDIIERFAGLGIDPFYIDLTFDAEQNTWVKKHGDKYLEIKGVRVGGVYARLGIGQRYATAYHPWAKPIERFHRTLVQSFSRELPGWCGSGHEQRPEKLTFELKSGRQILLIEEFCDRFYGWVVNKYHKTPHSGHGMDGQTPDEVFCSLLPQPQPCEPQLLDFALLKKDGVKIHNWGFNLHGRQFELVVPENLQGGRILNILIGQWATIFYDYDFKVIRVYKDNVWHCNARPLNRASFVTPNDPVMRDKLRLGAYQKQDAASTIKMFQEHPASQEDVNEAAALLEMSQEWQIPLNPPLSKREEDGSGDQTTVQMYSSPEGRNDVKQSVENEPICQVCPEDDLICITCDDRYRRQILPKLARGRELTPAQETFRQDFEASREYNDSQQLYKEEFKYMQYLAGRKA